MDTISEALDRKRKELASNTALKKVLEKEKNNDFYYTCYENPKEKPFMMVLQNPGFDKPENETDPQPFKNWIMGKQKKCFSKIISLLRKYYPIEKAKYMKYNILVDNYIKYNEYVENDFFTDFYVTDLIKIRGSTRYADIIYKYEKDFFNSILEKEIFEVKPKILFTFSSRTWDFLRSKYEINPIKKIENFKQSSITDIHGHLFSIKLDRTQSYLIPLAFPSGGQTHYLRNSYFDYLEEGLKNISFSK
jgi:hypothetical protein